MSPHSWLPGRAPRKISSGFWVVFFWLLPLGLEASNRCKGGPWSNRSWLERIRLQGLVASAEGWAGVRLDLPKVGDVMAKSPKGRMGGCQNYGPPLGPPNTRCHVILRTPKGTIILTTTHMLLHPSKVQIDSHLRLR